MKKLSRRQAVRAAVLGAAMVGTVMPAHAADKAADKAPEHPYMLWTREQAAAIRKKVETEPWAKEKHQQVLNAKGDERFIANLFRYAVMGDQKAGEAEKKYLLHIVGTTPANARVGRHYDCYWDALRYDVLYDLLTPEERQKVADTFRVYADHHLHDTFKYTRTSWLPNMQWPRPMAAHLMSVSLGDKDLVQKMIGSNGGWKWYFDSYIADGQFYMEEFGKQYSMLGEMLLFCRGLEGAGLNEWGYGYTGAGGATMRRYVASIPMVGYPRIEIPGGMPHYGKITMGDARGNGFAGAPPYVFQHAIVTGHLPDGNGGNAAFTNANMNGHDHFDARTPKLMTPLWFEIAQARWPDAGFDYFLAQMRQPGQDKYYPSLYFGLDPIDPKVAAQHAPKAPSYVAPERGFAFLRAEESPAYWESPAPAVALQGGSYYVHYVHDCLALMGFVAYNRPLYYNRQLSDGYAGNDPWTDSVRGHCGVVVDNKQAKFVDGGDRGSEHQAWRFASTPAAKFAAVQANGIYEGVDQQRALVLTKEYLLDVSVLKSQTPHKYEWQVHALGVPLDVTGWAPSQDLANGALYEGGVNEAKAKATLDRYDPENVRKLSPGDAAFSAAVVQDCTIDPAKSALGKAWYDRRIGVKVSFLPEAGTVAYLGDTARYIQKAGAEPNKGEKSSLPNEVGGTTLLVRRNTKETVFAALHEPFEKATPHVKDFRRVAQTGEGLVAAVAGDNGLNDRVMVQFDPKAAGPVTLAGDGESFTFRNFAHVRIAAGRVEVGGDLTAMRLKVAAPVKVFLNGKEVAAQQQGDTVTLKP